MATWKLAHMKWTLGCALVASVLGVLALFSLPVDVHGPGYWKEIASAIPYFAMAGGVFGVIVDLLRLVFRPSNDSAANQGPD